MVYVLYYCDLLCLDYYFEFIYCFVTLFWVIAGSGWFMVVYWFVGLSALLGGVLRFDVCWFG